MHTRSPSAAARDHETHPGGLHEKFMCAAFEAHIRAIYVKNRERWRKTSLWWPPTYMKTKGCRDFQ